MGIVEFINFSIGTMQKFTLSGKTGVTQEYCTVFVLRLMSELGSLSVHVSKSLCRATGMLYFFQILQFAIEEKCPFPFLQYFCQSFYSNYLCVDINYYKAPWNSNLLCNCTLFVQWSSTISSFENECLASTSLILPFFCRKAVLHGQREVFFCFPSSEIPCHWANSLHIGVLMLATELAKGLIWHEGFAPGEPWLSHLRGLIPSNVSQFWKAFLLLHIKYENYELTKENLAHCIRY